MESVISLGDINDEWKRTQFPKGSQIQIKSESSSRWRNVFNISEEDLPLMSQESGLSALVLESKIKDRAYPRADMEDDNAVIFLRIPQKVPDENAPKDWIVKWTGLLMIGCDSGLLTISNTEVPLVLEVPTMVRDQKMSLTYPVIFYTLTKESLSRVENIILSAEMDLVHLESIPMSKQPRSFLNITYDAKKEWTSRLLADPYKIHMSGHH